MDEEVQELDASCNNWDDPSSSHNPKCRWSAALEDANTTSYYIPQVENFMVKIGLGRIVALYYFSSTSYQIH